MGVRTKHLEYKGSYYCNFGYAKADERQMASLGELHKVTCKNCLRLVEQKLTRAKRNVYGE